jgi:O-antigen ligase
MGFAISILYFVTYYLTPATVFGPLAPYRVELILAVLVIVMSLPMLAGSIVLKTSQSLALIGLTLAVFLSVLIAVHWSGGALTALLAFIPCAFAYYLACLHCNTKKRLQIVVFTLLLACFFVIVNGCIELLHGAPASVAQQHGSMGSSYLLSMPNGAGKLFYRLKGLGQINDPNDFGQLLVCTIPLVFIFWKPKSSLRNVFIVLLPVSALLFGTFFTHSRGALLALMAIVIVAARRRIGTVPALVVGAGVFAAAMAMHFTGGRNISAEAGADRTALWGEGLQILKSHPFFGVGAGGFADNCDGCGHTAHNSLVVCAAEYGSFGLFFWCMFLFPTVRDALTIASPNKVSEGEPIASEEEAFPLRKEKHEVIDKAEINRLGRLLVMSLTGFLVTGWFLSRAMVLTLFLLGGMVEVVYEMALRRGMVAPRLSLARTMRYSAGLAVTLVLLMYVLLRTVNIMH